MLAQATLQARNQTLLMVKDVSVEPEVLQNQPLLLFPPWKRANLQMTTQGEHGLISGCTEGHQANAKI